MRRKILLVLAGLFVVLLLVFIYSLLWGPLRAFSPWPLGFQYKDTQRARIFFHRGADLTVLDRLDEIIAGAEKTNGLCFPKRVELFLCDSDEEHKSIAFTGARFCVLPGRGRLSISKRAQEDAKKRLIHFDVYLAHELSHSIIFQNTTLLNGLRIPDWFLEGFAVYTANQRGVDGYFTRNQVHEKIREGHYLAPLDFATKPFMSTAAYKAFDMPDKYLFLYAEMACFVEDIIRIKGERKFRTYKSALLAGKDAATSFTSIFEQDIVSFEKEFHQRTSEDEHPAN
jgi:hypothetical protein